MARGKKKARVWPGPLVALVAIVLSLLALVEYRVELGLTALLPSWDSLYEAAGLRLSDDAQANGTLASVYFIDVGQGDSTLIVSGGQAALIDAGEAQKVDAVIDLLNGLGITRLDVVVGTHPHSDHIGGLARVVEEFEIGTVILPQIAQEHIPTSRAYERLLLAVADKGLKIERAQDRRRHELGECELMVLGPVGEPDNLNDYSAVVKAVCGNTSVLITGDIEKKAEEALVKKDASILKADVIKVPHHGSKTSSAVSFLQWVQPRLAVVSCGQDNSYGHPHNDIVTRYAEQGIELLRTDRSGTITLLLDGQTVTVNKER